MEGVVPAISGIERVGGQKWGYLFVESTEDLKKCKSILRRSYDLIIDTISNNEPTGYWAPLDSG